MNREVHSDDGYLALPTDALGTEYYTISYGNSAHTTFAVLATGDSTQVSFKLINNTQVFVQYKDHSYTSNQWIDVTMNKFDVFLIHSKGHLTGGYIVASRPVGDISGNKQQGYGTPENRLTI